MNCSRCGGCLAIERSVDFYHSEGQWECINCGAHTALSAQVSRKLSVQTSQPILHASIDKL